ncbi:hypothetical protein BC828DRAFT_163025 [Blastocladiella britannica]|nr:hypothetical protein BC828DRAFT_163025 [Blastocladiella britannica]
MMAGGLAAGARHRNTYPPLFNEPGMRHSISTQMFAPHGGGGGGADPATLGRSRQTLAERFSEMTSDSRGHSTTHLAAAATSGALHPTGSSHALSRRPSLSHMRSTADLGGTSGGPESSGGGVRRERLLLVNFNAMYQRTRQVHSEKRGAMCAAERWRFAIFSVLGSVRAINTFKVAPGPSSSSSTSAAAANGGRSNSVSSGSGGAAALDARAKFRLGDYLATPSFAISPEMRLTLEKHRSEYSADDYAMLERLTERMPSFEKYTPSVRKQLCRLLQYERFGPNRVMIKQGHDPKSFYIIVGGRCNVYKEENGIQIDLNELNSGDAFGELALLKNTKRNASVKTIAPSEFFRVDRDDFLEVLKGTAEQDIQQKLDFFQSIPFLAALPLPNLMRLAEVCSRREWPTNSVITREREPVSCISLIRTGSVRVLRVAPFRKVPRVDGRYSLEPVGFPDLSSGSSSGGGGSRVVDIDSDLMETDGGSVSSEAAAAAATAGTVYKLLCVGVLPPGQYFGQEALFFYFTEARTILTSLLSDTSASSSTRSASATS